MRSSMLTHVVLCSLPWTAMAGELRVEGDELLRWQDAAELAQIASADGDVVVAVGPGGITMRIERAGVVVRRVALPAAYTQAEREGTMLLAASLLAELPPFDGGESTPPTLLQMLEQTERETLGNREDVRTSRRRVDSTRVPAPVASATRPPESSTPATERVPVTSGTPTPVTAPAVTPAPVRTWRYEHAVIDVPTREQGTVTSEAVTTTVLIGAPTDHAGDLPNSSSTVVPETDDASEE